MSGFDVWRDLIRVQQTCDRIWDGARSGHQVDGSNAYRLVDSCQAKAELELESLAEKFNNRDSRQKVFS